MSAPFHVVIPARLGSTRFPRKVLAPLAGLPMVVHVAKAALASGAQSVVVAADDDQIIAACGDYGVRAIMTRPDHESGTDRVAEVAEASGWSDSDVVVNVQGDEPLMPPALIAQCAEAASQAGVDIATPCHPITDLAEYLSPHAVKVIMDDADNAQYFSRAPIPAARAALLDGKPQLPKAGAWRHIGLYAYRVAALRALSAMPQVAIEMDESLEQLRALHAGQCIRMVRAASAPGPGVDTPEDLDVVAALLMTSS